MIEITEDDDDDDDEFEDETINDEGNIEHTTSSSTHDDAINKIEIPTRPKLKHGAKEWSTMNLEPISSEPRKLCAEYANVIELFFPARDIFSCAHRPWDHWPGSQSCRDAAAAVGSAAVSPKS